ncbi:precorrin-2 C(20)-methyltransferase [Mesobaculum littorinae]|uniref:Precorrin-2 C(20)-methyltransferase n=1 Tax=Mesobaculum littorinae TaxID=2486419 RepID=A0A438AFA2_9RHOB|nr:precorrin-2 C(20)-methyltransferase [Mesobaculum littorinae]RVV97400.1 precorrin-2 C(20)-methyltransferase [Mesobaculum littorinae]
MSGTLYGIGVGPGDPELLTLKAARLIASCPVVAYPVLPGTDSFARRIAAAHIPPTAREIAMEVPMRPDRAPAQAAYDTGAAHLADALAAGQDVACLCEGDPLFYGSFMYLSARLSGRFPVVAVPGVTSLTAAAAAAQRPLAARNDSVAVLPGTLPEDVLTARIAAAETVAILKVGRHLPKIVAAVRGAGCLDQASYVERASIPGEERVCPLAQAPAEAPYFSMILISKGTDPWL